MTPDPNLLHLFAHSPLPIAALHGPEHTVIEVNAAFCRLLGTPRADLVGRPVAAALPEGEACRALLDRVYHSGAPETLDEQARSRPPDAHWSYAAWPVAGPARRSADLLLQITDATGTAEFRRRVTAVNEELVLAIVRQQALTEAAEAVNAPLRRREAELERAVTEHETLLHELHHRVKNNLQMLCDAIYLETQAKDDPAQRPDLQATYNRIFAVARLYDQLYQGRPGAAMDLCEYLARSLSGFGALHDARIRLEFAPSDSVHLDADRVIYVGLILTELVCNAMKHAFPNGASGTVTVRLRRLGDWAELQVQDTGVGVPQRVDPAQRPLGLRMVSLLAKRLNAKVSMESDAGARVTVAFPLAEA